MSHGDSEAQMNLSALQRVDPYVDSIVQTAGHVALYSFNADTNAWQKTNIEGTLHVYTRSAKPLHSIMIMNRLNTNNLMEPIESGLDLQLQEPFLLYRNSTGLIYGIWFYNKEECAKISKILKSLAKNLNVKHNDKVNKQDSSSSKNIDLVSMLSRAQEDYRANKTSSKVTETTPKKVEENAPPQCVMDFFAKAGSGKNFSEGLPSLSNYASTQTPALKVVAKDNLMHKLMASPIHTVEQIEMQHRSVTPKSDVAVTTSPVVRVKPVNQCLFNNNKSRNLPNLIMHDPEENNVHIHRNGYHQPKGNHFNSAGVEQYLNSNDSINKSDIAMDSTSSISKVIETQMESEELMPPTRFIMDDFEDELVTSSVNTMTLNEIKPVVPKLEPLTKNQLLQAFDYLLKNDPDFMSKIHEAYVKSLLRN
ncbi:mRNA-decapping enzyme 1-like [Daktulosphaira vitifoliae]|uniref:mRNA-decapping enzyme 1-like n=1 Tax=Daktulosphaira vitifoliae TaxID=58002 RepID=UPI0021AA0AC6|nr:mRNA-decapping enzyme 1-like [Daktulosphaira vitifoliae]